jgi:hypothetical protein
MEHCSVFANGELLKRPLNERHGLTKQRAVFAMNVTILQLYDCITYSCPIVVYLCTVE